VERRSKCLLEAALRTGVFREPVAQNQLVFFELTNAIFVRRDNARNVRLYDPVKKLCNLLLDFLKLVFQSLRVRLRLIDTALPQILEERACNAEHGLARLNRFKQLFEFAFDLVAADRLAVARTALLRAEIVGMLLVRPLRPAGRQGRSTIGTFDIAT